MSTHDEIPAAVAATNALAPLPVEESTRRRFTLPSSVSTLVFIRDRGIIVLFLLMLLAFSVWASPQFGTFTNATLIMGAAAITSIFAVGVGFGVLTGLLDLSLPGTAAVAGVLCGKVLIGTGNAALAIAVGLAVGPVVGLVNAIIVLRGMNPLVVTIGTLSVLTGLASVFSGGVPVDNLTALHFIGTDAYFRIPAPAYVAAGLFIIGTIFLTQTRSGIRLMSVGGNAEAVRRVGVSADRYVTLGFILVSTCAALGGIVIAAFVTSAAPVPSTSVLFEALTAVALSGMPLSGGRGSLPRVLVGALIIQSISSALVIKNVQPYWSTVFTGVLLLAALSAERALSVAVANRVVERKPAPAPTGTATNDATVRPTAAQVSATKGNS